MVKERQFVKLIYGKSVKKCNLTNTKKVHDREVKQSSQIDE